MEIIKAPDFSGGGYILYDQEQMKEVFETGHGSVRIRSKYRYDKANNCIDILQIPYSTSIEQILKRLTEMVKDGSLKEVTDVRDEIDLNGFKLTMDLRRGVDPDKLMAKLFKKTTLEDSFKCNFNILIDSVPRQMGVKEILEEWIKFRMTCVRRELTYELQKKKDKLHLLLGLGKILLDIDKAIRIIRHTEQEADVVPNLEKGFSITQIQAEYIAEIKLRHLNREYILNRIQEIEGLQNEIAELEELLGDHLKIKNYIAKQLANIKKKYAMPRKSQLLMDDNLPDVEDDEEEDNYNVRLVLTREGYFKKITYQSLRGNDEQKLKEGDEITFVEESDNISELIFFTDQAQVYRAKIADFECTKASVMGEFLPVKLGMDPGEKPVFMRVQNTYPAKDNMIFIFANGKGVRVPVSTYQTKGARKKLVGAYSDASPIVGIFYEAGGKPVDILMISNAEKAIMIKSSLITLKTTRTSVGTTLMTLKAGQEITQAMIAPADDSVKGYRKIKVPATGVNMVGSDLASRQIKIDD